jgi:hypothetical protein
MDLVLHISKTEFEQIKSGAQKAVIVKVNYYWRKRVEYHDFTSVVLQCGVAKKGETGRVLVRKWNGYRTRRANDDTYHNELIFEIDVSMPAETPAPNPKGQDRVQRTFLGIRFVKWGRKHLIELSNLGRKTHSFEFYGIRIFPGITWGSSTVATMGEPKSDKPNDVMIRGENGALRLFDSEDFDPEKLELLIQQLQQDEQKAESVKATVYLEALIEIRRLQELFLAATFSDGVFQCDHCGAWYTNSTAEFLKRLDHPISCIAPGCDGLILPKSVVDAQIIADLQRSSRLAKEILTKGQALYDGGLNAQSDWRELIARAHEECPELFDSQS